MDTTIYKFINGIAGKIPFLGNVMSGVANDYFLPVIVFLIFVAIWFGTRDLQRRKINQKAILIALIAVGITNGLVVLTTAFFSRTRPFDVLPPDQVHLFYYRPHDMSFPSNFAAVLFAAAISIFTKNRKAGIILFVIAIIGAFGRVFIGIHYPTDVLGGAAYGAAGALIAYGIGKLFNWLLEFVLNSAKKFHIA